MDRDIGDFSADAIIEAIEAKGVLEGELKGLYKSVSRPYDPNNMLDFQAELPNGRKVFVDHKAMRDFKKLAEEKGLEVGHFPSHESVAFNMGIDSVGQKTKHIPRDETGMLIQQPGFPYAESDVIHLFNFRAIKVKFRLLDKLF